MKLFNKSKKEINKNKNIVQWTVPEEIIIEARCLYCGELGDVEWTNAHLREKQYYKLPSSQWKNARNTQFIVIKQLQKDGTIKALDGEK
jgi:hypothetical protein